MNRPPIVRVRSISCVQLPRHDTSFDLAHKAALRSPWWHAACVSLSRNPGPMASAPGGAAAGSAEPLRAQKESTMKRLTRLLLSAITVLTLSLSLTGCRAEIFRDPQGREYRHARWHDEHVYQREDGRWHARRHGAWVVVEDARPE
jgi:hypothetical protein